MGQISIPYSPGDYIMANRADSSIAKITSVNIGIRSGNVIITSGKWYYPIKDDGTILIVTSEDYYKLPEHRVYADYIVGKETDLKGIRAKIRYIQSVNDMAKEILHNGKQD